MIDSFILFVVFSILTLSRSHKQQRRSQAHLLRQPLPTASCGFSIRPDANSTGSSSNNSSGGVDGRSSGGHISSKARQNQARLLRLLHTVGQQNWSVSNCHRFRYTLDDTTSDRSSSSSSNATALAAVAPEKQLLFDYAFERLFFGGICVN